MKGNVVDGINVLRLTGGARLTPVTLEREIVLGIRCFHILNGHAALNRPQRKSCRVLILVQEDAHTPVLILERTLNSFHFLRLLIEIVDFNESIAATDDRHGPIDVRAVAFVGQLYGANGSLLPQVPELESLVPAACHDTCVIGTNNVVDDFDGRVVLGDLHKLVGLQVPHLGRLVAGGGEHLGAVVAPCGAEYGRVVCFDRFGQRLAVLLYLPAADVVRPRRADQERLRYGLRAELEAADAVHGRLYYFKSRHV